MWVIDGSGSPAAAIADTGKTAYTVSYDPYGVETVTVGGDSAQWQQNPYGFKVGLRSSNTDTGLTKFGYRWQSSITGAWIERDTLDAPLSSTNANRYAFAGADPINGSDPTGLYNWRLAGADFLLATGVGTGIGAAVGCIATIAIGCGPGAGPGAAIGTALGAIFGAGFVLGASLAGGYSE